MKQKNDVLNKWCKCWSYSDSKHFVIDKIVDYDRDSKNTHKFHGKSVDWYKVEPLQNNELIFLLENMQ